MLIETSEGVARFCEQLRGRPYIAIDTEFMGEKTYFPRLCLIQVAHGEHAAAIDALARGIDLSPLAELLGDSAMVKVLHSGRQDLSILKRGTGRFPAPIFDTQIAAAVCGMGEQPGYDKLVARMLEEEIDKASQATDWSLRPLSERQIAYALGDVTHLCRVYDRLLEELEERGRAHWIREEMEALGDPAQHESDPEGRYRRIKMRRPTRRSLAILRELASWRERTAMERDLPRGWVVRDDALSEIALNEPRDPRQLGRIRGIKEGTARGGDGRAMLAAMRRALETPNDDWPPLPERKGGPSADDSMVALLQALLRLRCDEHEVATRMVATRDDLEHIALGDRDDIAALSGWRREVFGADALALRDGHLALTGEQGRVVARTLSEE
ncbi:MAG: ribonuclease D [Myxococcales bacterium]|nr:ribonuclease D [Myxococcales bacterium]